MSVAAVTARIAEIRSDLVALGLHRTPVAATTAADFERALGLAATGATAGPTGADVVAEAHTYLGVPYRWGGTDPATGLDCSGLVQLVYGNLGIDLPRVSHQQATVGRAVPSLDQARPGDILAFGSPVDHVGIYIGGGRMIEAPRTGLDVRVVEVDRTPTAIRRVLPDTAAAAVAGPSAAVVPGGVPFADLFRSAGARHGVEPTLLAAIARQESGYRTDAVSAAGAQGLMQLMPGTARGLGVADPFDPTQAVDGAARLVRDLLDRFGSTELALAGYNAGPGAVLRYDGVPPYPETQNYVRSVMAIWEGMR